ncbi:MAG TPA: WYL domain-containing transcriptional regulator [Candidatus Baltobacteraceae bacterium]|nr:WYL domain-containing transcriptional regulator [Candidatus Baltobacteraceae bacterium]
MATKRFGKARPSGEPSGSTERKIRILLELIRNKFVRLSGLADEYGTSERSLLRDLQELRKIGKRAGFQLSEKSENDRVRLISFDSRPTAIDKSGRALRSLIRDAAHALGKPVEAQLESLEGEEQPEERRFLHFLTPTLREGSRVAQTYKDLEAAWASSARVTFRYSGKERRLEPACVFVRSGRYYLLGRDPNSRAWKYYALDAIEPPIKRAGSFTPQPLPAKYQRSDALGFFQGTGEERVSVWISPAIAPSATSRAWQAQQEVEMHDDGSATMTFTVNDVGEIVRWALGFGTEAKIIAPESAVRQARSIAKGIVDNYG